MFRFHRLLSAVLATGLAFACSACGGEAEVDVEGEGAQRYGYVEGQGGAGDESGSEIGAATVVAKAPTTKDKPTRKTRRKRRTSTKASKYKIAEGGVKQGGTVKGTCKLSAAPNLAVVPITKDVAPCEHEEHPSERAIYDAETLGLANCLIQLVDISTGKDWPEAMRSKAREVEIDQVKCIYVPHIAVARTKTQLVIHNSDAAEHNIHGYRGSMATTAFNVGTAAKARDIKPGTAYLKKAAKYILKCDIHPWMNAYVHVVNNPYFAVTDAKGNFEIKDVPPGSYTLRAWHESMVEEPITNGPEITGYSYGEDWEETRTVTVAADGTVTVEFVVPAP